VERAITTEERPARLLPGGGSSKVPMMNRAQKQAPGFQKAENTLVGVGKAAVHVGLSAFPETFPFPKCSETGINLRLIGIFVRSDQVNIRLRIGSMIR
jgi:hypothetical protein